MIRGVLFDMDGVLADSEAYICKAAIIMFSEIGLTVKPIDFKPFVGTGENRFIGGVAEKYGLAVATSFDRSMLHEADWICDSLNTVPEDALTW